MNQSESIKNLSVALLKAQKKIGGAVKGSANPFFKSKYANLGAVMEACKEALNEEGVSVIQPVHSDEHGDYVETILLHESGEFISSRMRLMPSKNMQELGSATTYARRFGLQSMVFIPSEDDDGESTMNRPAKAQEAPKAASKPALVATPAVQAPTPVTTTPVAPTEAPKTSSFKAKVADMPKPAVSKATSW